MVHKGKTMNFKIKIPSNTSGVVKVENKGYQGVKEKFLGMKTRLRGDAALFCIVLIFSDYLPPHPFQRLIEMVCRLCKSLPNLWAQKKSQLNTLTERL